MSRLRDRQDTKLYYSISEASAIAKVKPHVLRYWETQFKMLRPKKNKAGNRMYRKRDLKLIQLIKELLYEKGYTIAGARRKLLDERAALRETQMEITFTEGDRTMLLGDLVRDVRGLVADLKRLPGEVARRAALEDARDSVRDAAAGAPDGNGAEAHETVTVAAGSLEEDGGGAFFPDGGDGDAPDDDAEWTGDEPAR